MSEYTRRRRLAEFTIAEYRDQFTVLDGDEGDSVIVICKCSKEFIIGQEGVTRLKDIEPIASHLVECNEQTKG